MELKSYQKKVLSDLSAYLNAVNETVNLRKAWEKFWNDKDIAVGWEGIPQYQYTIPHVPHICLKVPTGGGKTFIACSAVKPIFDHLPKQKPKVVIWLVPSESILTQTILSLSNPEHPYRQRLNKDFSGRVGVYSKEALLTGQNFSPDTVREMLTVCVLSYASLRIDSRKKDVRKVYQENGNLMRFAEAFADKEALLADTPDTALIQVLRKLEPVVIVDESHNAGSELSIEMLKRLNPSHILELTATPRKTSNILCYVDARELKRENMVKLPVIVYNRSSRQTVISDAIRLRGNLEQQAKAERKTGGAYIRPIVLFQAQPNIGENSATFEKIRKMLIETGIPAEQIAVKTSEINDLGKTDLMREDCPIRYIITVNALKEGWDCPFAYILASLANKTSQIDVEQILGRILRQPYARAHLSPLLNTSFVLTCSNTFGAVLENIVKALNRSGFSKKDYMLPETAAQQIPEHAATGTNSPSSMKIEEDPEIYGFNDIDPAEIKSTIEQQETNSSGPEQEAASYPGKQTDELSVMISSAIGQVMNYTDAANQENKDDPFGGEISDMVKSYKIQRKFREEVKNLRIPQFVMPRLFDFFGGDMLLEPEQLSENFSLSGQDAMVSFDIDSSGQIYKIDLDEDSDEAIPKSYKAEQRESDYIRSQLQNKAPKERISQCARFIADQINKNDRLDTSDVTDYVMRVINGMNEDDLAAMETSIPLYAQKIREKIENLEDAHRARTFRLWLESGKIMVKPMYQLPTAITPPDAIDSIPKSLYEAEKNDLNNFEREVVMKIAALPNVRWWHRNIDRKGFRLNGPVKNHYPDFLVMTNSGKLVLAETKGAFLGNDDSREKVSLGRSWQNKAGENFRYFMVFQDGKPDWEGAFTLEDFMKIMKEL